jgi:hypothetical protein
VRQSSDEPSSVLTAVIASGTAPSTARAISADADVLGESLAKIGFLVDGAHAAITPRPRAAGSVANGSLPPWTLGRRG